MLYVQETMVNQTENCIFGESDVYETFTDSRGELFRAMRREYGRCVSRIYVDTDSGPSPIGWVFVKRDRYEDTQESYLREVWVTVHTAPPIKTTEYQYAEIDD